MRSAAPSRAFLEPVGAGGRPSLTASRDDVRIALPGANGGGEVVREPVATAEPCRLDDAQVAEVVRRARAGSQPSGADRAAEYEDLARFAVALTQASHVAPQAECAGDPNCSDVQAIALILHQYVVAFPRQRESVNDRARRLLSRIVERGADVEDDHPDLPIFQDFVLGRYVDLEKRGAGAFANWAADTTTDLRGCIAAVFKHEITDARRFYRARVGIPQRLRIEGAADVRAWHDSFASFILDPHTSVSEFTEAAELPWSWPHTSEVVSGGGQVDDERIWDWAHNCWFRALGDDASEARPSLSADHARISRDVDAFRKRAKPPPAVAASDLESLETLAAEHSGEWAGVISALEDMLRDVLPVKYEQITGLRQVTVQRRPLVSPGGSSGASRSASSADDPADSAVDVEREAMIAQLADALGEVPPPSGNGMTVSVDELAEQLVDMAQLPEPDLDAGAAALGCPVEEVERWWEHVRRCVDEIGKPQGGGAS